MEEPSLGGDSLLVEDEGHCGQAFERESGVGDAEDGSSVVVGGERLQVVVESAVEHGLER